MAAQKLSRANIAARIGASRAYVSKALRGEANLALLTLSKFAMAIGGMLHLHIADHGVASEWIDRPMGHPSVVGTTAKVRHGTKTPPSSPKRRAVRR